MTIYEPNDDIHPTGAEVNEFDDAPPEPGSEDDEEDVGERERAVIDAAHLGHAEGRA